MKGLSSAFLISAVLLCMSLSQVASARGDIPRSFPSNQELYELSFVVPDAYYVKSQCAVPSTWMALVRSSPELAAMVDMEMAGIIEAATNELCNRYRAGAIPVDAWLKLFSNRWDALYRMTKGCGRTVQCFELPRFPDQPLPSDFQAYAVLLFPSSEWTSNSEKLNYSGIVKAFQSFGESIGERRAAVYFLRDYQNASPDIERAKSYCDKLGLNYNDGPFLIVSQHRPDYLGRGDSYLLVRLTGISPDRIVRVFNVIEQDFRRNRLPSSRGVLYEEVKQRLLTAIERNTDLPKEFVKGMVGAGK